jgi:hypothetical protein
MDSKYRIRAEDVRGLMIGEHDTIYQYLQLPTHARLPSEHIRFFAALIADKTEGFVGRRFVFAALDGFPRHNRSGYFLVQDEPGIGKTALLAHWWRLRPLRRSQPH